jgi:hypothetical protein
MFNTRPANAKSRRTSANLGKKVPLSAIRTGDPGLAALAAARPDDDLLTMQVFDKSLLDGVELKSANASDTLEALRSQQRLVRVGVPPDAVSALLAQDLDSAHAIASLAEEDFVKRSAGVLSDEDARLTHHRALSVQSRVNHAWQSLRQHSSAFVRNNKFLAAGTQVIEEFSDIPSYQDLFGSLDYIEVPECRSVFGQAAYFTDVMRVTYDGITTKNPNVDPKYALQTRRPDLYTIELTCQNTDTPLPTVDVINAVLGKALEPTLGTDIDYAIATQVYPFHEPVNLPLVELRATLDAAGLPLSTLYATFRARDGGSAALPDALTTAGEALGLSCEQRAIVTTPVTAAATLELYFGGGSGASPIALAVPIGNVSVTANSMTVTGSGFTTVGIAANWLIQVGSYLRVVVSIVSDTEMTVDCAFPATASVAAFGYAPQSIVQKHVFAETTELTIPLTDRLVYQNLDETERAANLQANFFINSADGASIGTQTDTTDTNYSLSILTNLTDANIDRTNRFLRLANACGWEWEDLDWAIRAGGFSDITADAVIYLAEVALLSKRLSLGIVETTSLFAVLKTYGRGPGIRPIDPFDRIYNSTKLATGQPPYRPTYSGNPLFDSTPIDFTVPAVTDADRLTQAWLKGALGVTDNDLGLLIALIGGTDGSGSTTLTLDVPNLSLLRGYALLASSLKWKVPSLIQAMALLKLSAIASLADVVTVVEFKDWLDQSGLDLDELTYVVAGDIGRDVSGKLNAASIPPFMDALHVLSKAWLLKPSSFVYDAIAIEDAESLFAELVTLGLIDAQGVALKALPQNQASFDLVAPAFPVTAADLVSDVVTPEEAADAYALLEENGVIAAEILTGPVTRSTDLSYLFPGDPLQQTKTESVRDVLVHATDDNWHTGSVISDALDAQDVGTYTQLGLLMQITTELARVLIPPQFAPADTLQQLLDEGTDLLAVTKAIILADRWAYAADTFGLDALNMAPVVAVPNLLGIGSQTDPTLADIQALSAYAQTISAFNTNGVALTAFFALPASPIDTKMKALQLITGWPYQQSIDLVSALWGSTEGYNSPFGLLTMRVCFGEATALGLDTASAIAMVSLASTPMLPLPTIPGGSASGWQVYRAEAQAAVNAYHGRFQEDAWAEAYRPIHDATAGERRDQLVALGILILSATIEGIDSPETLSEYLLLDVEAGTCNDTTPMLSVTQAVQMYIQRCRLSLEPGITTVDIPQIYWSWLNSYRLWQANREIYIYPESYIDPALRRGGTPLYDDFVAELTQNEITPQSVTTAYTNYINKFVVLSALQTVDSVHCMVKDELSGEQVAQLIVLARTATKPYTYYWRTLRDETNWSAWAKVEASITVPTATPMYAFGRLFVFWVETETTQSSTVAAEGQTYNTTTRGTVNYSFQQLDGTWTSPQPVLQGDIVDFVPTTYTTDTINPSSTNSLSGIDLAMPYWHKPYVVLVEGQSGATDKIFASFGNAYPDKAGAPSAPTNTLPDERLFCTELYNVTQLSNAASATVGSVIFPGAAVIGPDLIPAPSYPLWPNATSSQPGPFCASIANSQMLLYPSSSVLIDNAYANASDYAARVASTAQGYCLYSVSSVGTVIPTKNIPGWYVFNNGDEAFLAVAQNTTLYQISDIVSLASNQYSIKSPPPLEKSLPNVTLTCGAYTDNAPFINELMIRFERLTTGAGGRLSQLLFTGGVGALLSLDAQEDTGPGNLSFTRFYTTKPVLLGKCDPEDLRFPPPQNTTPPEKLCGGQIDFYGAYGPYYREIYFFIPFLIATMLRGNQRYEEAKSWYDYIFNPTAGVDGEEATTETYWQYLPFRDVGLPTLTDILTDNAAIANWNLHPYDPFAVADLRLSAYQKTIVMHYIDNLMDWGDTLFRQETRESLNQALLVYLLANDLLGPRPVAREAAPEPAPLNFQQILDSSGGDVPTFLIDLESALPSAGATTLDYEPAPYNAVNAYFGVPEDQKFLSYWTRLEDRLYKLRNCMDITGVVRTLPFTAPPIDPGQLVKAAASGAGTLDVVAYSQAVLPNYRFPTMVERAKGLISQLMQLGAGLLAALEKGDAEYLSMLRTQQERTIALLTTAVKQQQITDAAETLASLGVTLESATYRRDYYQALLDTGLLPAEIVSITMMALANLAQTSAGVLRAAGGAAHLIPNVGSPFAMTYGGVQIGAAFDSLSALADTVSRNFDFASNLSSVLAGYQRRDQDWQLQEQLAAYEITQLQYQIQAAQARLEAAQRDFAVSQEQVLQAEKIERVLTDKFTNEELYNWMATRLSTIYFQTYKLAFDLAAAAQRAYQFELDSNATYLDFGYWDSRKKGLLAGEGLMLGLAQMEQAYLAGNARNLSIEKTISLRNINPAALLKLQDTGACGFEFNELLFDQDYPGHYRRKIQRIAVTVPAVVSPYQNLHGMLTQTGNVVVMAADIGAVKFLLGEETNTPTDAVLRYDWRANQQIALSTGVADTGLGPADGSDDRYVPFEGTGAVSQWRLELPFASNRIDYGTISDVIFTVTYSAVSGGKKFSDEVKAVLPQDYAGAKLINLAQEFSSSWYAFMHPGSGAETQSLLFKIPRPFFPPNLGTIAMTGAFFELILENVSYQGPMPFTLTVPTLEPIALSFPAKTPMTSTTFDAELDNTGALDWQIAVDTGAIPKELKNADGTLDPTIVVGWNMILTYTGVLPA